ncbi:DUF6965 family protein [Sphingobacterium olei]|nr:hypothetical protein [Sphingobacterium olei]
MDELKHELLGKSYPNEIQISKDQRIIDVDKFLKTQFIIVENWTRDLVKCPGYVRLLKFRKAISEETIENNNLIKQ